MMAGPFLTSALLLVLIAAGAGGAEQGGTHELRHDPFVRPPILEEPRPPARPAVAAKKGAGPVSPTPAPEPPWEPQLRGTLLAGRGSVANVDGRVLGLGAETEGRRLVEVRERGAVFEKGGELVLLTMDDPPTPLPKTKEGSAGSAAPTPVSGRSRADERKQP